MNLTIKKLARYKLFKKEKILSLELLKNQGFCNTNYVLQTSKQKYLIRVFKSDNTVNISRKFEFRIQKKAYKKNIAARPYLLDEKNQLMISEFLKGEHKYTLSNSEIKNLVKSLKKLHKIKTKEKPYNLKKDFNNYSQILKDKESKNLIKSSLRSLKKVKNFEKTLVTTHHDLNPKNIIFFKNSIKIIDWEYAGVNDAFFDIATICVEFKLNKTKEKIVLKSYFKNVKKEHIKKLKEYKNIYINLCKLWFKALEK